MDRNYVTGKVWNEIEKKYVAVIGYEFRDTPGFYQFYQVGGTEHFRKRPQKEQGDQIAQISKDIFDEMELV